MKNPLHFYPRTLNEDINKRNGIYALTELQKIKTTVQHSELHYHYVANERERD